MTKILLIGATFTNNRGAAAMLISTKNALQELIPDARFAVITPFPESDRTLCNDENIRIIGDPAGYELLRRIFRAVTFRTFHYNSRSDAVLNEMADADIIVDLSGDGFTDDGGYIKSLLSCYDIILSKIIDKPMVIYAQSIGPFNSFFTRRLSTFCLNRVDILTVREEITKQYLEQIGVHRLFLTADSAFLLESPTPEEVARICIREGIELDARPIVGISASQHIFELEGKQYELGHDSETPYVKIMVEVINYLKEKYGAQVIFFPHVTNEDRAVDDRYVARMIFDRCEQKDGIALIDTNYSAEELKGVIGVCDLFLGARMHANIAATSMGVPTISFAYSHKSYGIMKTLGMEEYVVDFRTIKVEEITNRIDELWNYRDQIRERLMKNKPTVNEKAWENAKLVKKLLDQKNQPKNPL